MKSNRLLDSSVRSMLQPRQEPLQAQQAADVPQPQHAVDRAAHAPQNPTALKHLFACPCIKEPQRKDFVVQAATHAAAFNRPDLTLHWYDIGGGGMLHNAFQAEALSRLGFTSIHLHLVDVTPSTDDVRNDVQQFVHRLAAQSGCRMLFREVDYGAFIKQLGTGEVVPRPHFVTLVDPGQYTGAQADEMAAISHILLTSTRPEMLRLAMKIPVPSMGLPVWQEITNGQHFAASPSGINVLPDVLRRLERVYRTTQNESLRTGEASAPLFARNMQAFAAELHLDVTFYDRPQNHYESLLRIHPEALGASLVHSGPKFRQPQR